MTGLVDLRLGDLRDPPVEGVFPLVVVPFRSLLHMETDHDRRAALASVRRLLGRDGRFIFDVFTPSDEDIAETHGRWLEREAGIWERADWDVEARTLILRVRGETGESEMSLAWLSVPEWRVQLAAAGFEVEELYGWFDRTPWDGGEDSVWVCRRPFVEGDRTGGSNVQRLRALDRDPRVEVALDRRRQPVPLGSEQERDRTSEVELGERASSGGRECNACSRRGERADRDAPERARARTKRLRSGRVGAPVGQLNRCAEGIGRADQRPHVPGVGDAPECQRRRPL